MLTEAQTNRVWEKMIAAEVRSLYFAELASRYTRQKQIITGISFFLSSGAAATIAARMPEVLPLTLASVSAFLMAYSIAVNLDKKAANMAKLHYEWNRLAAEYDRLWNRWYDEGAAGQWNEFLKRAADVSEMGATEAPYDVRLLSKWQDHIFAQHGLTPAI